ncbi:MAG: VF530 family protein [Crocinitomicaceae bacterium]|nr:VF530 family protein [Crocinitomicaceae bacterium]
MQENQPNNPVHGVKIADMLNYLIESYGWEELAARINIRCFRFDPSVKSSLVFLRKTPWAKEEVQKLYIRTVERNPKGKPYQPKKLKG